MSLKQLEHQIATDLEAIMQQYLGQPLTEDLDDPVRLQITFAVENYLAKLFGFDVPVLHGPEVWNPLPVRYVSTTTPTQIKMGQVTFEFRDRTTDIRILDSKTLIHLLTKRRR